MIGWSKRAIVRLVKDDYMLTDKIPYRMLLDVRPCYCIVKNEKKSDKKNHIILIRSRSM